jgi:voltage-gated potassium channel
LFRLLKMIRMYRGMREIFPFVKYFTKNKLRSILTAYVLFMILVLFYCAAGFYVAEKGINESVNNYFDAFWWSFITVTSVGYGDIFPKTTEGRIIAIVLSLLGIGLFSIITAEIAAKFVKFMKEDENKGSIE